MFKIEYIWRELLYRAIEKKETGFNLQELADRFKLSTSVVAHALKPLRDLNIVQIGKLRSSLIDAERLLFFWATRRNLKKEIIYQTYSELPIFERETAMPSDVLPTAYSACRLYYNLITADYDNIYFYANSFDEVKKRFPHNVKRSTNLFIFQADEYLFRYKKITLAQIFVDLWNLPEWYAKDFQDAVLLKIKGEIGL